MKMFTGFEYLLIDCANNYGHDKFVFEDRIQWAKDGLNHLEDLTGEADEPALYQKSVMAIRKAQAGLPTGHRVGMDSVCSGMQLMSALTGCLAGATATGLVDPYRRADAYTTVTDTMRKELTSLGTIARADAKDATMHTLYGSVKSPKKIFGDGTPEHKAFHKALNIVAPGAMELLGDLRSAWQPFALSHDWTLPDAYDAHVPVKQKVEARIEVDELDHATFGYIYEVNEGLETGLSLIANTVHSVDAYVLRSLVRRCNYDPELMQWASHHIEMILLERSMGAIEHDKFYLNDQVVRMRERYEATQMPDIRILDYCQEYELMTLSTMHLRGLASILNQMLQHRPFEVLTVHDDFSTHPNYLNFLRLHYREILAQLAESTVLDDILSQLYGTTGTFQKKSTNLGAKIRKSNYALS